MCTTTNIIEYSSLTKSFTCFTITDSNWSEELYDMCSFTLGGVDSEFDSNTVYANDSELTDMVVLELTVFLQFVCICFIPYHLM